MSDMQQFYEQMQSQDDHLLNCKTLVNLTGAVINDLRKLEGQETWSGW